MTTEQILNHIREVCGLIHIPEHDGDTGYYLPVQLEHLLYVIGKHFHKPHPIHIDWEWGSKNKNKIQITIAKGHPLINIEAIYDLTRTVEQNLNDNAELRELITSLIN